MPSLYRVLAYVLLGLATCGVTVPARPVLAAGPSIRLAAGPANAPAADAKTGKDAGAKDSGTKDDSAKDDSADDGDEEGGDDEQTPEDKMQSRFPQPVRVGDLIGLPVLDDGDATIGYVRQVQRTAEGKIVLIVPYSAWFGWANTDWGKRPVAVPIEVVTILARQLDSVDMAREDFDKAPTWAPTRGKPVDPEEKTLIALGRR